MMDLALSSRHTLRNIVKDLYPKIKQIFTPEIAREIFTIIDLESSGSENWANLSDLLRYIILLVEGGWYMDSDLQAKTFHSIKDWHRNEMGQVVELLPTLQKLLTPEEYQIFRLGRDKDFRDIQAESKERVSFDAVVNKLRNELFLNPINALKKSLDQDDLKTIAVEQPLLWDDLINQDEDEFYTKYNKPKQSKFRDIYLKKYLPKFIQRLPDDSLQKDSNVHDMKQKLNSLGPGKLPEKEIHHRRFIDCNSELLKSPLGEELKKFQLDLWYEIEFYLKKINFSLPHDNLKYGAQHSHGINCCVGAAPHHKVLYKTIIAFIECFQMQRYQMPLDIAKWQMSRGPIRIGESGWYRSYAIEVEHWLPSKIAAISQYTLMDMKRCKKSLLLTEQQLENLRANNPMSPVLLHRRELGIQLGVNSLCNVHEGIMTFGQETDFGIPLHCDNSWLRPSKKTSFDTTDCRRLAF